jgi:hypothetical protein
VVSRGGQWKDGDSWEVSGRELVGEFSGYMLFLCGS